MTPQDALKRLLKGNKEHLKDLRICIGVDKSMRHSLVETQRPFAVIVSCSDSRVPPELIFHQKLGDLFVVRAAGSALQEIGLGSIEFAVKYLGASLVMVLGHRNCGAVQASLSFLKTGKPYISHIQTIINTIVPALKNKELYESSQGLSVAVKDNVRFIVENLNNTGPILKEYVTDGRIKIVGAYYDLKTGKVTLVR